VASVDFEWDPDDDEDEDEFVAAVGAGRLDDARTIAEIHAADPESEAWTATGMLEDIGLALARAGRHDDAIEAFERALALDWDVVPDGRCEIARVLLLAGRCEEADALWARLRDADPDGVWTLNAGGLAYHEVDRHEEAVEWLAKGLYVAIDDGDPERVVDQMSHARRLSLRRLGRDRDALEREVETFRADVARRDEERAAELRRSARRAGLPIRRRAVTAAWMSEEDDQSARERWPDWAAGVLEDGPFAERAARLERSLRARHAAGTDRCCS